MNCHHTLLLSLFLPSPFFYYCRLAIITCFLHACLSVCVCVYVCVCVWVYVDDWRGWKWNNMSVYMWVGVAVGGWVGGGAGPARQGMYEEEGHFFGW